MKSVKLDDDVVAELKACAGHSYSDKIRRLIAQSSEEGLNDLINKRFDALESKIENNNSTTTPAFSWGE